MIDAVTELLLRYELGDFDDRVRARLAAIFADDPPDAMERLERAAEYLALRGVTRSTLERVDASLSDRSRTPAFQKPPTARTENPTERGATP